jgi:peptidoglycan-N-acetylglucosamine deacetylase
VARRPRTGVALAALAAALAVPAAAQASMTGSVSPRPCTLPQPNPIAHVEARLAQQRYALTFDESLGPLTIPILRILERYDARATFFVVGAEARRHPRLVRAIARRGHELANHTFSHSDLATLSPAKRRRELARTQRLITRIAGVTPCYMRPPANGYNRAVVRQARRLGLGTVLWSLSANEGGNGSSAVTARVVAETQPGSIVLFHQVYIAVWALPDTLEGLAERGLDAVTVRDLLTDR